MQSYKFNGTMFCLMWRCWVIYCRMTIHVLSYNLNNNGWVYSRENGRMSETWISVASQITHETPLNAWESLLVNRVSFLYRLSNWTCSTRISSDILNTDLSVNEQYKICEHHDFIRDCLLYYFIKFYVSLHLRIDVLTRRKEYSLTIIAGENIR